MAGPGTPPFKVQVVHGSSVSTSSEHGSFDSAQSSARAVKKNYANKPVIIVDSRGATILQF